MSAPVSRASPTLLFWGAQPLPVYSVSIDIENVSALDRMTASKEPTTTARVSFNIDGELSKYFNGPGRELKLCIVATPEQQWVIVDAIARTINYTQSTDGRSELSISLKGAFKNHKNISYE